MQILDTAPTGWTYTQLTAFNQLISACHAYMIYDYALTKLNVTDPTLLQRRTQLGQLITETLGPAFRGAT